MVFHFGNGRGVDVERLRHALFAHRWRRRGGEQQRHGVRRLFDPVGQRPRHSVREQFVEVQRRRPEMVGHVRRLPAEPADLRRRPEFQLESVSGGVRRVVAQTVEPVRSRHSVASAHPVRGALGGVVALVMAGAGTMNRSRETRCVRDLMTLSAARASSRTDTVGHDSQRELKTVSPLRTLRVALNRGRCGHSRAPICRDGREPRASLTASCGFEPESLLREVLTGARWARGRERRPPRVASNRSRT